MKKAGKTICIIATASHKGGALTIYKQLISWLCKQINDDKYYIFINPNMPHVDINGITYIKKRTCGFGRIWFDFYGFNSILNKKGIRPDVIVSFQNSGVKCHHSQQIIYFHQALTLNDYHIGYTSKVGMQYHFYHDLYPLYIKLLLKKNTRIAVQTKVVKNDFIDKFKISNNRIAVFKPDIEEINTSEIKDYPFEENTLNFLYPAIASIYKEHKTIIQAINNIKQKDIKKRIRVHFTCKKEEIENLLNIVIPCDINGVFIFHGSIPHDTLLSMYKKCDGLLFPSEIETVGLPLLEAAAFGLPIIVNDKPYARDVLNHYEGAIYLHHNDYSLWASNILRICLENPKFKKMNSCDKSSWPDFFHFIHEENNLSQ